MNISQGPNYTITEWIVSDSEKIVYYYTRVYLIYLISGVFCCCFFFKKNNQILIQSYYIISVFSAFHRKKWWRRTEGNQRKTPMIWWLNFLKNLYLYRMLYDTLYATSFWCYREKRNMFWQYSCKRCSVV